jgi:hypothetical protein
MATGSKTSRKVKQGKVEIDFEATSLVINYEVELVRTVSHSFRVLGLACCPSCTVATDCLTAY